MWTRPGEKQQLVCWHQRLQWPPGEGVHGCRRDSAPTRLGRAGSRAIWYWCTVLDQVHKRCICVPICSNTKPRVPRPVWVVCVAKH